MSLSSDDDDDAGDDSMAFTFTHSTHVRLLKKKPEHVYAVKTLRHGLLRDVHDNCRITHVPPPPTADPEETQDLVEFELSNCDVSIANALRRIMLADVPTCAIDDVYIRCNTGVMQDEMLAHRLGMIPILHPGIADFKAYDKTSGEPKTSENTLVFRLKVSCGMADLKIGEHDSLYKNVYSSDLKWVPQGAVQEGWVGAMRPRCTLGDIVITRLGLNQSLDVEAHCVRGVGAVHAKWSPVATASYRMHPEIRFRHREGVVGEVARELVRLHGDIFDLEEVVDGDASDGGALEWVGCWSVCWLLGWLVGCLLALLWAA